jgi:hypothetical protein
MSAAVSPKTAADGAAWHAIAVDKVLRRLTTSIEHGLDAGEASARLQNMDRTACRKAGSAGR